MKKKLVVLLAALMCISLCACGSTESTSRNSNNESTNNETTQSESSATEENNKPVEGEDYAIGEDGTIAISKKYCAENMTLVEITTENWKEYFQLVEETMGTVDDFGEVTYTTKTVVKPYSEGKYVYGFYNPSNPESKGAFEFKNLKTEQTVSKINLYDEVNGTDIIYGIDDFELTKVSATLMIINIPDELWNKPDNGLEYVHIGKVNDPFPFTYQSGEEVDYYIVADIIELSN